MLAESSLLLAQESKIAYTHQLRKDIACTVKETDYPKLCQAISTHSLQVKSL